MESVSTTVGRTSSAGIPSTSAACMAMEVRVPPISVEPSTRFTVPSALTLTVQLDVEPEPHRHTAPAIGPAERCCVMRMLLHGLDHFDATDAAVLGTVGAA